MINCLQLITLEISYEMVNAGCRLRDTVCRSDAFTVYPATPREFGLGVLYGLAVLCVAVCAVTGVDV